MRFCLVKNFCTDGPFLFFEAKKLQVPHAFIMPHVLSLLPALHVLRAFIMPHVLSLLPALHVPNAFLMPYCFPHCKRY